MPWEIRLSLGCLLLFVGLAVAAPYVAREPYDVIHLERRFCRPDATHWFGCDELGRDLWTRWVYGARVSLFVATVVTCLAGISGGLIGVVSGLVGGWIDTWVMRVVDVMLALPGLLLALAFVAFLGAGLRNLILALVITGWAPYARLIRGETLRLRELDFVKASRAMGGGTGWILRFHLLPHLVGIWSVQASLSMAGLVLAEAGLSFLGLGIQPPVPSWGRMLTAGLVHLMDAPHLSIFPGIGITLLVLAFTYLGEYLEQVYHRRLPLASL